MDDDDFEFCECDEDEEYDGTPIPISYLTWQSFVGIALDGVESVLVAVSGTIGTFSQMFLGAHNRLCELNRVHAEMTRELETLLTGEEE